MLVRGVEGAIGPGRVTKALDIDRKLNRADVTDVVAGLWIEDRGVRVSRTQIVATPRVGVDYAGPVWARKPWRFIFSPPTALPPPSAPPRSKLSRGSARA
ncbi:MAG: DNA-3-methyladenine glycosylase [Opitutaceae bacterium]